MALGLGITPEEDHAQPFSSNMMRGYFEEAKEGMDGKDNNMDNGASAPKDEPKDILEIPYEYNATNNTNNDPRSKFKDEYELMQSWVSKPRPIPAFAIPKSAIAEPDSPTHSWSRDSPIKKRLCQAAPDANKGGMDAKGPAKPDGYASKHDVSRRMELEEGYFRVRMLTGDTVLLQYGDIVDLIRMGELPDGWSAFRETDDLWISVYKAAAEDGTDEREVEERLNLTSAQVAGEGVKRKRHEPGGIASTRTNQAPGFLREEFVRAARESHEAMQAKTPRGAATPASVTNGVSAPPTSQPPMHYARKAATELGAGASRMLPSDFFEAAELAHSDLTAYNRVLALRSNASLLCGGPKRIDAGVRAMVKDKIMVDRGRLRDIASGALQKALRIFVQRRATSQNIT